MTCFSVKAKTKLNGERTHKKKKGLEVFSSVSFPCDDY